MKKGLIVIGVILVALTIMAPAPEKAEKLKIEGLIWDGDRQEFVISMSCQFGMATAAEASGNFTVRTTLKILDLDDGILEKNLK